MKASKRTKSDNAVFSREWSQIFKWEDLNGKHGTIRISENDGNRLVAFHEDQGGLYVLEWQCKYP